MRCLLARYRRRASSQWRNRGVEGWLRSPLEDRPSPNGMVMNIVLVVNVRENKNQPFQT